MEIIIHGSFPASLRAVRAYLRKTVARQVDQIRREIRSGGLSLAGCEQLDILCEGLISPEERTAWLKEIGEREGWNVEMQSDDKVLFCALLVNPGGRVNCPSTMEPSDNAGSYEEAVKVGRWLLAKKASLPDSESFVNWLKKNCQLSERAAAYNKIKCAKIYLKDPKRKFASERAALASEKCKPQSVPRLTKVQRLIQAIAARLVELENSRQAELLSHAAFTPDAPPGKELECAVLAWMEFLQKNGMKLESYEKYR